MSAIARSICLRCRIRLRIKPALRILPIRRLHASPKRFLSSTKQSFRDDEFDPAEDASKLTEMDSDQFLETLMKEHKRKKNVQEPTTGDAVKVDQEYSKLLSDVSSIAPKAERLASRADMPTALRNFDERFRYPDATQTIETLREDFDTLLDQSVTVYGFVDRPRRVHKNLFFAELYNFSPRGTRIKIQTNMDEWDCAEAQKILRSLGPFVPVAITGRVHKVNRDDGDPRPAIKVEAVRQLNFVEKNLIYTPETVFPLEKRHLQLRTQVPLQKALRLRAKAAASCRRQLEEAEFLEVETPLLFKSTPEGAREFLVPTRDKRGLFYALPQSPQQYKQILMASGVPRYYQLARCFRDEDLRADRQPEFTQLDLEMSFARGKDVMELVEGLVKQLWKDCGMRGGALRDFRKIPYIHAMKKFGTDKPDMRDGDHLIHKLQAPTFRPAKHISHEGFLFRFNPSCTPTQLSEFRETFHTLFREIPFTSYIASESTAHGVPEHSLTAADVEAINESLGAQLNDLIIMLPRRGQLTGGSTPLGQLRTALYKKARAAGVLESHPQNRYRFVWITDFPLFTPATTESREPGQAGIAGLQSTHHPFTAPHEDDIELLASHEKLLQVRAEHFDLVLNGVELGGGSRRIHDPELQRWVLHEVLKVKEERRGEFDHLLEVLGSGCPPHAGMALGFDRLVSIMAGMEGVRDVIAFPKNKRGVDPMVGSPARVGEVKLAEYYLKSTMARGVE